MFAALALALTLLWQPLPKAPLVLCGLPTTGAGKSPAASGGAPVCPTAGQLDFSQACSSGLKAAF